MTSPARKKNPVVKILLLLVGSAIGVFLGKLAVTAFENRPGKLEADFEQVAEKDPTMGPMFRAFRDYFPTDYAAFKAEMIARHRAGATAEQLNQLGFERMAAFRKAHARDLAQAPSADLQNFRARQAALINGLAAESPEICAHFAGSALQPSDRPSPANQKLLSELGAAQFRAIAAAQKNPVKRETSANAADAQALVAQMKKDGMSESQLAGFTGAASGPLSDTDQCQVGVILGKSLAKLPVEQADRITAFLATQG